MPQEKHPKLMKYSCLYYQLEKSMKSPINCTIHTFSEQLAEIPVHVFIEQFPHQIYWSDLPVLFIVRKMSSTPWG